MHTMKNTFVAALLVLGMASAIAAAGAQPGLWDTLAMLKTRRWVDLTHTFDENSPHWKGFSPLKRTIPYDYAKDGFRVELTTHVGQWGTHMDAPNHFHAGKRSVDQIELQEMLLPLVVIDIHAQVDKDPDYTVRMEDVQQWEATHGHVPRGAFVALRTDWSKRWPDQARIQNLDATGVAHYPGWSKEVLRYLYETRGITASGHETHRYRSRPCHQQGRLFTRSLHPGAEPLPDRTSDQPGPGSASGRPDFCHHAQAA
jgi:kynurenine formamidase